MIHFHGTDRLAGFYKLTVIGSDGRRKPLTGWRPNIITDLGLDNFGYGATTITDPTGWMSYCRVGTGTKAVSESDTAMDIPLAEVVTSSRTYGSSGQSGAPHYRWQRDKFIFPQGSTIGIITEVGVGRAIAQGGLSTRALIVDEQGQPDTVPVLADEQLEVTYEIRTYITNLDKQVSQMAIGSTLFDTIRAPMNIDSAEGMVGRFGYGAGVETLHLFKGTDLPNIADTEAYYEKPIDLMEIVPCTRNAYGSGLYYRDSVCSIQKDEANYGTKGITAIGIMGFLSNWQMSYTQNLADYGIPHNANNIMTVSLRHTWGRYTP